VVSVHRTGLTVHDGENEADLPLGGRWFQGSDTERPTVGDWVVLDAERTSIERCLDRKNLLRRRSPDGHSTQAIAANVDSVFIVTACNDEFNLSRLERYLALVRDAQAQPVVVLTKGDGTQTPDKFEHAVRGLSADLPVSVVDARDESSVDVLRPWCGVGRTLVMVGSSGVGKSPLLNSLAGDARQRTGAIREADSKGRHTTSHRSLHALPDGTLLIDSPGIRELGLVEQETEPVFEDIEELAQHCRFSNCQHGNEPGCAVLAAVAAGVLSSRRVDSFRKLGEERVAARARGPARSRGGRGKKGKL